FYQVGTPKYASCPFSTNSCSCAQKKPEHNTTCKHECGLLGSLMQWRRCPSNDTGISDPDGLGLDCIYLLEFFQEVVVYIAERIWRAFEFAHRNLGLAACPRFSD